jgi:GH24 family phage-related lysozyme (muramidase)
MNSLLENLRMWEGSTDWLYLDTVGIPTVGYGFAVPRIELLGSYYWSREMAVVQADWRILAELPKGKLASYYAPFTRARLLHADVTAAQKLADLEKLLERPFKYSTHPQPVQEALVDLCWNLGLGGLSKYTKLRAALDKRDYATCARECSRRGVSDARNKWTRNRFDSI